MAEGSEDTVEQSAINAATSTEAAVAAAIATERDRARSLSGVKTALMSGFFFVLGLFGGYEYAYKHHDVKYLIESEAERNELEVKLDRAYNTVSAMRTKSSEIRRALKILDDSTTEVMAELQGLTKPKRGERRAAARSSAGGGTTAAPATRPAAPSPTTATPSSKAATAGAGATKASAPAREGGGSTAASKAGS